MGWTHRRRLVPPAVASAQKGQDMAGITRGGAAPLTRQDTGKKTPKKPTKKGGTR